MKGARKPAGKQGGKTAVWYVLCPHRVGRSGGDVRSQALPAFCWSALGQRRGNLWLAEAASDPSFYCSEEAKQTPARLPPPLLCRRLRHPLCSAGTSHATISLSPSPHFSAAAAAKRQTRTLLCPSILSNPPTPPRRCLALPAALRLLPPPPWLRGRPAQPQPLAGDGPRNRFRTRHQKPFQLRLPTPIKLKKDPLQTKRQKPVRTRTQMHNQKKGEGKELEERRKRGGKATHTHTHALPLSRSHRRTQTQRERERGEKKLKGHKAVHHQHGCLSSDLKEA